MYRIRKQVDATYEQAVEKTKEELKKEGFGVLTEINVKATLKKKLDVDFEKYVILGACNPPLAYKALQSEQDIGLLLPCNVIVYEQQGSIFVSAIKPSVAMNMVENQALADIAVQVEEKLNRVVENI